MARYTESVCRLCRRENQKLYLKGERCYTDKCAVAKRAYAPGQHGQGRKKLSNYGVQLREKQKTKRYYGILEGQFRQLFEKADRMKGKTGENLLQLLETRLDNVVYRMGFASSRSQARQLVNHGHFRLNGRKADIASMQISVGDVISVKETSKSSPHFKDVVEAAQANNQKWLSVNTEALEGKVIALPTREDIDLPIEEHLIVELYSR
jgi:small subunit ribosomal protein S4